MLEKAAKTALRSLHITFVIKSIFRISMRSLAKYYDTGPEGLQVALRQLTLLTANSMLHSAFPP